jgi:hypothetical protein
MKTLLKSVALASGLAMAAGLPAIAGSSPNLQNGQVPTAAQWNSYFASKQDDLGYVPLNTAGGIMTGRLVTAPPGAQTAGFNLTPGTTPAQPADGDLWMTSSGVFAQVNGTTIDLLTATAASMTVGITDVIGGTSARVLFDNAGVLDEYTISGTGSVAMTAGPTFTGTIGGVNAVLSGSLSLGGATIGGNVLAVKGPTAIQSNSSTALAVGANGATNPVLTVDGSRTNQATGLQIVGNAAGSGTGLNTTSTATNENLSLNAKGSGIILIGNGGSTGTVDVGAGGGGLTVHSSFSAAGLVTFADMATAAVATGSQYQSGASSVLVPASVIYSAEATITFGSTISIDTTTFINAAVTLTGNITTMNFTPMVGKSFQIRFIQDSTGGRSTVWNSLLKFPGGVTPTLSTIAGAVDVLEGSCITVNFCAASLLQNVK